MPSSPGDCALDSGVQFAGRSGCSPHWGGGHLSRSRRRDRNCGGETMYRRILPAALGAALLCAASAPALSQQLDRAQDPAPRGWFEYFATGASCSLAGDGGGGFGARLLLRVPSSAPVLERVAVGGDAARLPAGPGSARAEYGGPAEWSAPARAAPGPVLPLGLAPCGATADGCGASPTGRCASRRRSRAPPSRS